MHCVNRIMMLLLVGLVADGVDGDGVGVGGEYGSIGSTTPLSRANFDVPHAGLTM